MAGFGTWMHRLSDFAFGYDFFISYRQDDGRSLPRGLAIRLSSLGFRVFLDENNYVAGDELSLAMQRRVQMSSYMLLVARAGAMSRSPWVMREVELSLTAGKRLIILDVNNAFLLTAGNTGEEAQRAARLRSLLGDRLRIPLRTGDDGSNFDGDPPAELFGEIKRSFEATRQDSRRSRFFGFATVAFAALALGAMFLGWQANVARERAELEGRKSRAGEFAARSELVRAERPQLAALLARSSVLVSEDHGEPATLVARQALLESVVGLAGVPIANSKGPVSATAKNPAGSKFASSNGTTLQLWNVSDSGEFAHQRDVSLIGTVMFVGFGSGDEWVAASGKDFVCFLKFTDQEQPLCDKFEADDGILEMTLSPDGRFLAGASYSNKILAWDLTSPNPAGSKRALGQKLSTVRELRFSADGKRLIAWGITASQLWVWSEKDIEFGAPPVVLEGHSAPVKNADISGNSDLAASADDDGNVLLWNLASDRKTHTVLAAGDEKQWTIQVGFSNDGKWLAIPRRLGLPGKDNLPTTEILLFRISARSAALHARLPHDTYADSFSFDPTSRFLLALGTDGTNWLWNLEGGFDERQSRLVAHQWPVNAFAFSGDGSRLVTADRSGRAFWWDLGCQWRRPVARQLRGLEGPFSAVLFGSPKGWLIGADGRNIRRWDATLPSLGEPLVRAENCKADIDKISLSASGRWLATADKNTISLFDAAAAKPFEHFKLSANEEIESFKLSPTDDWLVARSTGGDIIAWDLKRLAASDLPQWRAAGADPGYTSLGFSRDGNFLLSSDMEGKGTVWDMRSVSPIDGRRSIKAPGKISDLRIGATGNLLAGIAYDTVWLSERTGFDGLPEFFELYRGNTMLRSLLFSPDGRWLLALEDEQALVWALPITRGTAPQRLPFPKGDWSNVAMSKDGRWLFLPVPGKFELWDLSKPKLDSAPLYLKSSPAAALRSAFSPDNRWFASGYESRVYLWDLLDFGRPPSVFDGGGSINAIAFSRDGTAVAFGSDDGNVATTPVDGGGSIKMPAQTGSIQGLSFSTDGKWIISATYSSVRMWPTQVDHLMGLAKERVGREPDAYERQLYLEPGTPGPE
jgi:WD40 repeat protein